MKNWDWVSMSLLAIGGLLLFCSYQAGKGSTYPFMYPIGYFTIWVSLIAIAVTVAIRGK